MNIQIHAANNDSIDKLLLQNLKTRFTRGVIYVSFTEVMSICSINILKDAFLYFKDIHRKTVDSRKSNEKH